MDRLWPTVLTTVFIAKYRSFPSLWKNSDKIYLNRKKEAYHELVNLCKLRFPTITRDLVVKKIQSPRGSFWKELKKVQASKHSGASTDDIYTPSLWYYELLLFTADCETASNSSDKIATEFGEKMPR